MTHTQEVAQIAREISKLLGLNDQLTEAIALAHDIGHTPFGHQGERTLDEILRGKKLKELGLFPDANIDYTALTGNCGNPYGGFKHNFQTVRVLLSLEEGHVEFEGINPTLQVLEGALWHTKARLCCCESCENRSEIGGKNCTDSRCCDPCDFAFNDEQLFHRNGKPCNFSRTLEGQVVAIADEIAQRSHDLDDAFSSELININDLIDICNIRKMETLKTELTHLDNAISKAKQDGRMFTNEDGVRKQAATSLIVKMFIKSVVDSSPDRMRDRDSLSERFHTSDHWIDEKIIDLDPTATAICKYIEQLITSKVLMSPEVSRFDNKASMIVSQLFAAYYRKPQILPPSTLRHMAILERAENLNNSIDLSNCNYNIAKQEIGLIQEANVLHLFEKGIDKTSQSYEYAFKKKLLVRLIVDHIAGMTDTYATTEYEKIYHPGIL